MHYDLFADNLIGIIFFLLLACAVFGVMVSLPVLFLYTLIPQAIKRWVSSLRWLKFWTIIILLALGSCLFGLGTGYYSVWWDHRFDPAYTGTHGFSLLAIPGAPGDMIANSYGGDWQQDEAWFYRFDITIWNGLFWAGAAVMALVTARLILQKTKDS
jgi:hypothetical protein